MSHSLYNAFQQPPQKMSQISVLVPVYNERKYLCPLVEALAAVKWPLPCEWVFIDDASVDGSYELLEQLKQQHKEIRLLRNEKNVGKSGTLVVGIEAAIGDIILVQDADLEYLPSELPKLVRPVQRGQADVVFGSRFKKNTKQVHRTYHRYVNVFLTVLSNLMSGIYLSDMETCYKVFRADILKSFNIRSRRFGFEPEVTAYVAKFNLRILELPILYFPRARAQGKKIRPSDGFMALWYIFKFNLLISPSRSLKKELLAGFTRKLDEKAKEERWLKTGS